MRSTPDKGVNTRSFYSEGERPDKGVNTRSLTPLSLSVFLYHSVYIVFHTSVYRLSHKVSNVSVIRYVNTRFNLGLTSPLSTMCSVISVARLDRNISHVMSILMLSVTLTLKHI